MHRKLFPRLTPALLLVIAVFSAHAQVQPAASQRGLPLVVGGGMSDYAISFGRPGRMEGISAWVDFFPYNLPHVLNGLGAEVTGHDINYGRPADISRMRQDTGLGGPIYAWNRYRNFRPYAKFLVGIGNIDFAAAAPPTHDTYLIVAPAGGVEYRIWQHIWVRGDYEYQSWRSSNSSASLNPNGFTIGASYDFRTVRPK